MSAATTKTKTPGRPPGGKGRDTPAMRQFDRFKAQHPGCVLLFRMGDFYELFDEDAVRVSRALGLTLTERTAGIPMAGVPHHSADGYIKRMLGAGFRVAIADQIQDPKEAKGVVERAVTRVLTPGTLIDENLLEDDAVCLIAAACVDGVEAHLATIDASTGSFALAAFPAERLGAELARRPIAELIIPEERDGEISNVLRDLPVETTPRPGWIFRDADAAEALKKQFRVASLAGFDLPEGSPLVRCAGALVRHLLETQAPNEPDHALAHLSVPTIEQDDRRLHLDAVSLRALEVEETLRRGERDHSLVGTILASGGRRTAMGKRLVREWLREPLADLEAIGARHARVATLAQDPRTSEELAEALDPVQDVARIAGRLGAGRVTPRDVVALGRSLGQIDELAGVLEGAPAFGEIRDRLLELAEELGPVAEGIVERCHERPPAHAREGGIFRDGVDPELDEARTLGRDASGWLAAYQGKIAREHDLPSLKVGFNKVFGYYLELPAAQARRAPEAFTRKQTLKNAERYTTPELKAFEQKATTAEARAIARERALFDELAESLRARVRAISAYAAAAAELDATLCFAEVALKRGWARPEMVDRPLLEIRGGRHPVLERTLGSELVPNDVCLGSASDPARLAILTGPNMAGKSTYIRQAALLTLLAHAGSFVPAESATVGLTDRICTRVGADDALHAGQSTFMVEMTETASILTNATDRTLVILDEIGRGTGTLDGLSLAWAIAERLSGADGAAAPRTLFATHYHELTALEESLPGRARNLTVAVREWRDEVVFLHQIMPGRSDRSYGVHVARLAGVPGAVIERATELLSELAVTHGSAPASAERREPDDQMPLFAASEHPCVAELRELELETMTPLEAFDALRRLAASVRSR